MKRLWESYRVSAEPSSVVPVEITGEGFSWEVKAGQSPSMSASDPWMALIHARNEIASIAVERAGGVVALHAAAVARNEGAILLCGPPWAGKTLLSLALVDRGWRYLSDDVAMIDVQTGVITPFFKPLGIKTESWTDFQHLWAPAPSWLPEPIDVFLIPPTSVKRWEGPAVAPKALIFLRYEKGAGAAFSPVTGGEALLMAGEQARRRDVEALSVIARLVRSTPSAMLAYGDRNEAVEVLAQYLHEEVAFSSG